MKKKLMLVLAVTTLFTGVLSSCSANTKKDSDGITYNEKYDEKEMTDVTGDTVSLTDNDDVTICKTSGFGFVKPKAWGNISNQDGIDGYSVDPEGYYMLYMPAEQVENMNTIDKDTMTDEEVSAISKAAYASEFYSFVIYRVNEDDEMTITDAEEFKADFEHNEKIGEVDKDTFYFAYNDSIPTEGFSENDQKDIQIFIDSLQEVKDSIILFPPTDPMDDFKATMSEFTSEDLDGNKVTADIFKDYDVTMVNVWATWCKYCVQEMPEIQALYETLPGKTNIITICTDGDTETETAKDLLKQTGATFTTIKSCAEIEENVLEYVTGYPTTFFVDKDGNVIGQLQIGTPAEEGKITAAYLELVNDALASEEK